MFNEAVRPGGSQLVQFDRLTRGVIRVQYGAGETVQDLAWRDDAGTRVRHGFFGVEDRVAQST